MEACGDSVEACGKSGVLLSSYFGGITLHAGGQNKIIQVGDSNTAYKDIDLSNYPIDWKAIKNVTSNSMLIGVYHTSPGTGGATDYMNTIGFMCSSQNATNYYYIEPLTGNIKLGNSSNFTNYMNLYK